MARPIHSYNAINPIGGSDPFGIPAAIGAGYLMASQLFGVKPWSPSLLVLATLLLGSAAFVAAWLPAQRAAQVEPIEALRSA